MYLTWVRHEKEAILVISLVDRNPKDATYCGPVPIFCQMSSALCVRGLREKEPRGKIVLNQSGSTGVVGSTVPVVTTYVRPSCHGCGAYT